MKVVLDIYEFRDLLEAVADEAICGMGEMHPDDPDDTMIVPAQTISHDLLRERIDGAVRRALVRETPLHHWITEESP